MTEQDRKVTDFRIDEHEKRLDKIDIILDKVRNRLPNWASFTFAALLAVIGFLIKGIL